MLMGGVISKQKNRLPAEELAVLVASACQDAKGIELAVYDVHKITDLAERFVIVSGRSDRHVQGIVNRILKELQEKQVKPDAIEGYEKAHWVVLDLEHILVHVFYEPVRQHYDLESLWHSGQKLNLDELGKTKSKHSEAA
jgi:ribosome-associated protein